MATAQSRARGHKRMKRTRQLRFSDLSAEWAAATLPNNVVVIDTSDGDIDRIVSDMLHVPTDKSVLLDFWVGHVPGTPSDILDGTDKADLLRLQYMLNARYHGRRFDWLADTFLARMVRLSIKERRWDIKSESGTQEVLS